MNISIGRTGVMNNQAKERVTKPFESPHFKQIQSGDWAGPALAVIQLLRNERYDTLVWAFIKRSLLHGAL